MKTTMIAATITGLLQSADVAAAANALPVKMSPAIASLSNAAPTGLLPASGIRPALGVRQSAIDLGKHDGSAPLQGEMTVINAGRQIMHILKPRNTAISRLQLHYPDELAIAPGASLSLPWQYDLHGSPPGQVEILLEAASDDPAAPLLTQSVRLSYAPQTQVTPFRSAVLARGGGSQLQSFEPVAFSFAPLAENAETGAGFTAVHLLDRSSPLKLHDIRIDASGKLTGQVQIDIEAIGKGAAPAGETRIVASTRDGGQSYFFIQWLVLAN